jgi:hypothetical protein
MPFAKSAVAAPAVVSRTALKGTVSTSALPPAAASITASGTDLLNPVAASPSNFARISDAVPAEASPGAVEKVSRTLDIRARMRVFSCSEMLVSTIMNVVIISIRLTKVGRLGLPAGTNFTSGSGSGRRFARLSLRGKGASSSAKILPSHARVPA